MSTRGQLDLARDRSTTRETDRDRNRQTGKGAKVDYYTSMGMNATEEGFEQFKDYQAEAKAAQQEEQAAISAAQAEVNAAKSQVHSANSELSTWKSQIDKGKSELQKIKEASNPQKLGEYTNKAWDSFKNQKLVRVNVVSGADNKVEGSYYIAKQDYDELAKNVQWTNYSKDTGQYYVHTKSNGRIIGQELHDGLRNRQSTIENEVKSAAQKKIAGDMAQLQNQYKEGSSQLSQAQQKYDASKGQVIEAQGLVTKAQGALKIRQEGLKDWEEQEKQWLTDLADKENDKIKSARSVLLGVEMEKGETQPEQLVSQQIAAGTQVEVPEAQVGAELPKPEQEVANA